MASLNEQDRQKLIKINSKMATNTIYHIGKAFDHASDAREYRALYDVKAGSAKTVSERLQSAQLKYKESQENAAVGRSILKVNSDIIMGSLAIGAATAGTGTAIVLATAAVTYGMQSLLDYTDAKFQESSQRSAENLLRKQLAMIERDHDADLVTLEQQYKTGAQDEKDVVIQELFDRSRGIFPEQMPGEDEASIQHMQHTLSRLLEKKMETGFQLSRLANEALRDEMTGELHDLKEEIDLVASNGKLLFQVAKEHEQSIKALQEEMGLMSDDIGALQEDVTFLNQYVFSTMPPKQQKAFLKSQNLLNIPDEQKAVLEKQIDAAIRKENVIRTTQQYMNYANDVGKIINSLSDELNIDPKLVNDINSAIEIGNAATQAFANFATGNWLGGVSTLAGAFFGGGKKDPAAERHNQIMEQFKHVLANQHIMMEQLETIQRSINQVVENQIAIMDFLNDTFHQLQGQHFEILRNEHLTRMMVSVVLDLQRDEAWDEIHALEEFFESRDDRDGNAWNFKNGEFVTYQDMVAHYANHDEYIPGWIRLNEVLSHPGVHSIFVEKTYVSQELNEFVTDPESNYFTQWDPNKVKHGGDETVVEDLRLNLAARDGGNKAAYGYWNILLRREAITLWLEANKATGRSDVRLKKIAAALVQCAYPCSELSKVTHRWRNRKGFDVELEGESDFWGWVFENMQTMLNIESVIRVVDVILEGHVYQDLIDPDTKSMIDTEVLLDESRWPPNFRPGGRSLETLNDGLRLVTLAIIQETIMLGEGILPAISYSLTNQATDEQYKRAYNLLHYNETLRKNWIRYLTFNALDSSDIPAWLYHSRLGRDGEYLDQISDWINKDVNYPREINSGIEISNNYSLKHFELSTKTNNQTIMTLKSPYNATDGLDIILPEKIEVDKRTGTVFTSPSVARLISKQHGILTLISDYEFAFSGEKNTDVSETIVNSVLMS